MNEIDLLSASKEEQSSPKTFAFVIMPFDPIYKDIYQLGIKEACHKAGAYCERVDEQVYDEDMVERIYNQINKADFVIAELSSENPNVYFELGYARALNKRILHIAKTGTKLPFDTSHYPHIKYQDIGYLVSELEKWVRWAILNASATSISAQPELSFILNGESASNQPILTFVANSSTVPINIAIHNPTNRFFSQYIHLSLKVDSSFPLAKSNIDLTICPDKSMIGIIKKSITLYPDGWESIRVELFLSGLLKNTYNCILTYYTPTRNLKFR